MAQVRPGDVERLARVAPDSRALRAGVVELLGRQVAIDWSVVVLTDPRTAVGVDPLATVPEGVRLPHLIRAKYLTEHHRWTRIAGPVRLSEPDRSPWWREQLRGLGVVDVLSGVLRDGHGTWGFLDLWSRTPFTGSDLALVAAVTPALTAGVRRCHAATLTPGTSVSAGPAVVLLDDDLTVVDATALSRTWLAELLPPRPDAQPVPAVVLNVAAQLLALEAGVDDAPPEGRVHLAGGRWVTVRAARLGAGGRIAVSMEPTAPADRADLVGRVHGLTPRESAVVAAVCAGSSNADVAAALHLSPLTVQDHLKSAFARTGTHSRGELAALFLGAPPPDGHTRD